MLCLDIGVSCLKAGKLILILESIQFRLGISKTFISQLFVFGNEIHIWSRHEIKTCVLGRVLQDGGRARKKSNRWDGSLVHNLPSIFLFLTFLSCHSLSSASRMRHIQIFPIVLKMGEENEGTWKIEDRLICHA